MGRAVARSVLAATRGSEAMLEVVRERRLGTSMAMKLVVIMEMQSRLGHTKILALRATSFTSKACAATTSPPHYTHTAAMVSSLVPPKVSACLSGYL